MALRKSHRLTRAFVLFVAALFIANIFIGSPLFKFAGADPPESNFPPLIAPLPNIALSANTPLSFQIEARDANTENQLELIIEPINNSENPLNHGASISFISQQEEKTLWQFSWQPDSSAVGEYLLNFRVSDSETSTAIPVQIIILTEGAAEIISTPAISTEPQSAVSILTETNEIISRDVFTRTSETVIFKAVSQSSLGSNLQYQFAEQVGDTVSEFEWQNENEFARAWSQNGTLQIKVRARSSEDNTKISDWASIPVAVKTQEELLPPPIRYMTPKLVGRAIFDASFFPNSANTGLIDSYRLTLSRNSHVIQETIIPAVNENDKYEVIIDLTENQELIDLINSITNGQALGRIRVSANSSGTETHYALQFISRRNFPEIENITVESSSASALLNATATNPGGVYNITSFRLYDYQTDELLQEKPVAEMPFVVEGLELNTFYENQFYIRPVDNSVPPQIEGSKTTVPPFQTQDDNTASYWSVLNSNTPIDAGEPIGIGWEGFTTLKKDNSLLYLFNSKNLGTMLARFNEQEKKWEIWDGAEWSDSNDAIAEPISHSMGIYYGAKIFPDPDNDDGLIALGIAFFRIHNNGMDTHGAPVNFRFNGSEFRQWNGNADFEPFKFKSLIPKWGGGDSDFAFNEETGKGIVVGTLAGNIFDYPPYHGQLTAAMYDHSNSEQSWLRWNNGSWIDADNWPGGNAYEGQPAWILDDNIEHASIFEYSEPRIIKIPNTEKYLVTFNYRNMTSDYNPSNVVLGAALYSEESGVPVWQWWDGEHWQTEGSYDYANLSFGASDYIDKKEFLPYSSGAVSLFFSENGKIYETIYNENPTPSWSQTQPIVNQNTCPIREFATAKDGEDNLFLVYKKECSSNLFLVRRISGGEITAPEIIYSSPQPLKLVGINIINNKPIIFISRQFSEGGRLFAIAEPDEYWQEENPVERNLTPEQKMLNETLLALNSAYTLNPEITGWFGDATHLTIDSDGYLYAPISRVFTTLIINPAENFAESITKRWGWFNDKFLFPGGVDIDEIGHRIYITNQLVGGGGSQLSNIGYITSWDYAQRNIRDENLFSLPFFLGTPGVNRTAYSYGEQLFGFGLAWPSDVSIDDERGLLVVSNSGNNQLKIYDIRNLIDLEGNENQNYFPRDSLLVPAVGYSWEIEIADSITQTLIDTNMLGSFNNAGTEYLYWIATDEQAARTLVETHPQFESLSSEYAKGSVLRHLSSNFKSYRQLPQFLGEFGEEGSEIGQMKFPQGHDFGPDGTLYVADSENHRIQKFIFNETTQNYEAQSAFGTRGSEAGQFLFPLGVSVDKTYNIVFITDPFNKRVQIFDHNGNFITEFNSWQENQQTRTLSSVYGIDTDGNGNIFLSNNLSIVKISMIDSTPEINAQYPQQVIVNENFQFLLDVSDDWGLTSLAIFVDDIEIENESIDFYLTKEKNISLSFEAEGTHEITVIANDAALHETSGSFPINVYEELPPAPQIQIISPINDSYNASTILVNISSDGTNIWFSDGIANYNYTEPTLHTFAEGANTLTAYASNGIETTSASVTFIVDITAPAILISSPQNNSSYNINENIPLTFTVQDTALESCWYVLNNSTITLPNCTSTTFTVSQTGNYALVLYASDAAGNINSSQVSFSIIQPVPPNPPDNGGGNNGGGGGGGGNGGNNPPSNPIIPISNPICVENWECDEWSACIDGLQTRICNDANNCGTFEEIPPIFRECQPIDADNDQDANGSDSEKNIFLFVIIFIVLLGALVLFRFLGLIPHSLLRRKNQN